MKKDYYEQHMNHITNIHKGVNCDTNINCIYYFGKHSDPRTKKGLNSVCEKYEVATSTLKASKIISDVVLLGT